MLSRPTLAGLGAIAIWSTLALCTAMTGRVPPFLTTAIAFAIGGSLILAFAAVRGRLHLARPSLPAFLLGLYGPFGDTVIYFAALKLAPPAEANLIHYLWPLLIVLFATFLPGGKLNPRHLGGALLGLVALFLLVGGNIGGNGQPGSWLGYALALLGAFVWASYSVLSRLIAASPTESLSVTILVSAVLAFGLHLAFEEPGWPIGWLQWVGLVGLGLGSQGLALIFWDIGMKRGDVSFLGVASYAAPVLSTILLVLTGFSPASWALAAACLLIVAGAVIASRT